MLYVCYDLETTGLPRFDRPGDDPSQPWIVDLAVVLCEEDGTIVDEFETFIRPDGWRIDEREKDDEGKPTAFFFHRITNEMVAGGLPVAEAFERAHAMMRRADMTLSYGIKFDEKCRRSHLRRSGLSDCFNEWPVACIQPMATALCKMAPTEKMMASGRKWAKTPKLIEAHEILLGEPFDGAHRAMPDCKAAARVLFECIRRGKTPEPIVWPSEKPTFDRAADKAVERAKEIAKAPPPAAPVASRADAGDPPNRPQPAPEADDLAIF